MNRLVVPRGLWIGWGFVLAAEVAIVLFALGVARWMGVS